MATLTTYAEQQVEGVMLSPSKPEKYKFSLGQQVEFRWTWGPFLRPRIKTLRGKIIGYRTSSMNVPMYEVHVEGIKRFYEVCERDVRALANGAPA